MLEFQENHLINPGGVLRGITGEVICRCTRRIVKIFWWKSYVSLIEYQEYLENSLETLDETLKGIMRVILQIPLKKLMRGSL